MSRLIAFCFLLLAAVLGFLHIDSRPIWAPFSEPSQEISQASESEEGQAPAPALIADPVTKADKAAKVTKIASPIASSISTPQPKFDWLPSTEAPSVHAASLVTLKDGSVRAFWFAGSREGAPDVVINSAVFDPKTASWSDPTVVIDRMGMEIGLSRYIAKLGNPVPARLADGRLQLFVVTVSIGGWAGSSITSLISDDEGKSWGRPQRLITSPLINLSTLVKSPALTFADGRLGLPAYHEWIGRFGELIRVEGSSAIDKRRMSSGRDSIQPAIFIDDAQKASAFFRQTRASSQAKKIPVSITTNAGQSWQVADDLDIANPNSAIAALSLKNGTHIMVLNNIEAGRHRLVMVMNRSGSSEWTVVQVLEDDEALPNEQRREFSYPFLLSADGGDAHLVYTWDRKKIRHIYFPAAWLKQTQSELDKQPLVDSEGAR